MYKTITRIFILILFLVFGSFFYLSTSAWFDFSRLENYNPGTPSVILDTNGIEIFRFELDKRKYITYDQISPVLVKAFVAAEDHNFFYHSGISFKGLVRSLLVNIYHGGIRQGASTITQQVIRLLYLNNERNYIRKIKEIFLALSLERYLTKEQIFEIYVNNIYFGHGIYGVEAACKRFWNKSVWDINVTEAATLAAVAKSAFIYSPLNAPLTSKKRRNVILRSMSQLGFITQDQFLEARESSIDLKDKIPGNPVRLYIQEWIRHWAENKWDKNTLYKNGLIIKTTIDLAIQEKAEKSFIPIVRKLRESQGNTLNGGMISVEANTGKIKAMIGGLDFNESQYNRAFQAKRQTGSSFKPIIFAAAIKKGIPFDSVYVDEPLEIRLATGDLWTPRNWTRRFDGPMTLVKALSTSNNMIAIKLFLEIGSESIIELAKEFGFSRDLKPYPSLALGTAVATVEENVTAFNVFASHGYYVKSFLIEWVKNRKGKKIFSHVLYRKKILDDITNSKMINALSVFMKRKKKFWPEEHWLDVEVIGKTGSTNNSTSNWYVGSTPKLTTAVYVGRDDGQGMGQYIYSSQTTYPIWFNFNKKIKSDEPNFYVDPSLKEIDIDWLTGQPSLEEDINTITILK